MEWKITFYNGKVLRDVRSWPNGIYASFLRLAGLLENFGLGLRMPYSRAMGRGLFELRCRGSEGIGRVFYCTVKGRSIVILHAFIKKTQETPIVDLKIARRRLKEVKNG
jgi:phage-related protein